MQVVDILKTISQIPKMWPEEVQNATEFSKFKVFSEANYQTFKEGSLCGFT